MSWTVLYEFITNPSNPSEDLSRFFNVDGVCHGSEWQLVEVGMGHLYWGGEVTAQGRLVNEGDQVFESSYDYDGMMQLQVLQEDESCEQCDATCDFAEGATPDARPTPQRKSDDNKCKCQQGGACSTHPIRYSNGAIVMRVEDLSSAGFGAAWGHERSYGNRLSMDADYGNGYNWMITRWPYLVYDSSGDVAVVFDGQMACWFYHAGEGFRARYGSRRTLVFQSGTFRLTNPDGEVWEFHSFAEQEAPGGSFKQHRSAGGQVTAAVYVNGRISAISRGDEADDSECYRYEYGTGAHAQRIQSVTLWRCAAGGTEWPVARVRYEYHPGSDSFGNLGDLKAAIRQRWVSESWVDGDTYYYRYYKSGNFVHGLKYVLDPADFDRLRSHYSSPYSVSDAALAPYASHYFQYDGTHRVVTESVLGGTQTYGYTYSSSGAGDGPNLWRQKTVETRPDGSTNTLWTNYLGDVIVEQLVCGTQQWIRHRRYDQDGREILEATPSAVSGAAPASSGEANVTLQRAWGLIRVTRYYGDDQDEQPAGYVWRRAIRQGSNGATILLNEYRYTAYEAPDATLYLLDRDIRYAEAVDENSVLPETPTIETAYGYSWYEGTGQMAARTTTLPAVSAEHHGPGGSAARAEYFDLQGRLTQLTDERGVTSSSVYDPLTGGLLQTSVAGETTDYQLDDEGRPTRILGPWHTIPDPDNPQQSLTIRRATWNVYRDDAHEVWTASGYLTDDAPCPHDTYYDDGATLVNPVAITRRDAAGRVLDQIQAVRLGGSVGALAAGDQFRPADYCACTSYQYDAGGRLLSIRQYHDIPNGGYTQTSFGYDAAGRQNRVTTPGGTITRTVFDGSDHPLAVYVGTDDRGATDSHPDSGGAAWQNNMRLVSTSTYDYGGAGNGNLTGVLQYLAGGSRSTVYGYDWRDRRLTTSAGEGFSEQLVYDHLDRAIQIERRQGSVSGRLLAQTLNSYDDRDRVYQRCTYSVNPQTGAQGPALVDNTWYDAAGNVIKYQPGGGQAFSKTDYDDLGRVQTAYLAYDHDEATYAEALAVDDDTVLQQTEYSYDAAGNLRGTVVRQRLHDQAETVVGALQNLGAEPGARVTTTAAWYDPLGRVIATADYGQSEAGPPSALPARSDDVLLTTTAYNDCGQAFSSVGPAGRETRTTYDARGRVTQTIQNYVDGEIDQQKPDEDVTVEMEYNADGKLVTLTAHNPAAGDVQVTRYVYGTLSDDQDLYSPLPDESDIARADLLREEIDPNGGKVAYCYNRQGEVKAKCDQNGTIHTYAYDGLGRPIRDAVTELGYGVDGRVRRIETVYEARGNVQQLRSYDNPTVGQGTLVSDVLLEYNGFGQVVSDYQEHQGAVNTSTSPKVGYVYADGSDHHTRRLQTIYPNGRVLHYGYNSGRDDALNRVSWLADDNNGQPAQPAQHLVEYDYLGAGGIVRVTYPEPNLRWGVLGGPQRGGNAQDPYGRMDRFGRTTEHVWRQCSGATESYFVRIGHGYDRAGNRLWRQDFLAATNTKNLDERYAYDGMNQLVSLDRGQLNRTKTGLVPNSKTFAEDWSLDMTGNWSGYRQDSDGGGTWNVNQTRTHDAANAILSVSDGGWAGYDGNGNMTTVPGGSFNCTYDAWNRLVRVRYGNEPVAEYQYDGRNFRIAKKLYANFQHTSTVHSYYHGSWQELEQRIPATPTGSPSSVPANRQFVWGLRYIDDLVLRDRNRDTRPNTGSLGKTNSGLDERYYVLQDANWNVVAITTSWGGVVKRLVYSAYGTATFLEPDFSVSSDGLEWETTYTGRHLDRETGFLYYRMRYVIPPLGRFGSKDPIGYWGGMGLMVYVSCRPVTAVDPSGLMGNTFGGNLLPGGLQSTPPVPARNVPPTFAKGCTCATISGMRTTGGNAPVSVATTATAPSPYIPPTLVESSAFATISGTHTFGGNSSPLPGFQPPNDIASWMPGMVSSQSSFWWYGNWGGPNWTGGQVGSWNTIDQSQAKQPINNQDRCYQNHDLCYGDCRDNTSGASVCRAKCFANCDRLLALCLAILVGRKDPSADWKCKIGALLFQYTHPAADGVEEPLEWGPHISEMF